MSPTDSAPVFEAILESAVRLCKAPIGGVCLSDGQVISMAALRAPADSVEVVRATYPRRLEDVGLVRCRAIREGRIVHVADVLQDSSSHRVVDEAVGLRGELAVPMWREGRCIGAIAMARPEPGLFTESQVALIRTLADQAVIAIENVRLFTELQEKNRALTEAHAQVTEALEQQTATADILKVIASSPTAVQPVFEAIAASAARLCEAYDATIFRRDGDRLLLVAHHGPMLILGPIGEGTLPLIRGTANGQSVLDGRTIHVRDLQTETNAFPEAADCAAAGSPNEPLACP